MLLLTLRRPPCLLLSRHCRHCRRLAQHSGLQRPANAPQQKLCSSLSGYVTMQRSRRCVAVAGGSHRQPLLPSWSPMI